MVLLKTEGYFRTGIDGVTDVPYLHGLDEARAILDEGLRRGYPLVVKGDPDVDGYLAYAVASAMLRKRGIPFYACVNRDRLHGLVESEFEYRSERSWGKFKYIPTEWHRNEVILNLDSSISGEEMQLLVDNGCYIVSLDHHELELDGYPSDQQVFTSDSARGIIINNQYSFEPVENRFWSGTGVTLHALSYILDLEVEREWVAMHGITLLSDVRDIENTLAREILGVTYTTPLDSMPTLRKLSDITQESVSLRFRRHPEYIDRTFVDYSFSPYYNASYQLNLIDILFRLIDDSSFYLAIPSKDIRKGILNKLKDCVDINETDRVKLLHIDESRLPDFSEYSKYDFKYTSFIGLLANSFMEDKTVFIYATSGSKWLRGSVRGYNKDVNYNKIFADGGFEVKGHRGAFGVTNVLRPVDFGLISREIAEEESLHEHISGNLMYSDNLLEDREDIYRLAKENEYLLSQDFHRIVYRGFGYTVVNESAGKIAYNVNGMYVDSFDKSLTPDNASIVPTVVDGRLVLTLRVL